MARFPNAAGHYTLPTYLGGTNPAVHPSVIDFLTEHGLPTWGGYRYWMAYTPYASNATESPSICATNDLVNGPWVVPLSLPNPIAESGINGTFNDPHIEYDPVGDRLLLIHGGFGGSYYYLDEYVTICAAYYWIYSNGTVFGESPALWGDESDPGANWFPVGAGGSSITLLRDPATARWHAWHAGEPLTHQYCDGDPTVPANWSAPAACTIDGGVRPAHMVGWVNNHPGGKLNVANGNVEFCLSCHSGTEERLAYLVATFANPTALTSPLDEWLLEPSVSGWDAGMTYRSILLPHADAAKRHLVYSAFSGVGPPDVWIGRTEGVLSAPAEYDLTSAFLPASQPADGHAGSESGALGTAGETEAASGSAGSGSGAVGAAQSFPTAEYDLASAFLTQIATGAAGSGSSATGDAGLAMNLKGPFSFELRAGDGTSYRISSDADAVFRIGGVDEGPLFSGGGW